jgi:hypothetical protein
MYILQLSFEFKFSPLYFAGNIGQAFYNSTGILLPDYALFSQHYDVGDAAGYIVTIEAPVER